MLDLGAFGTVFSLCLLCRNRKPNEANGVCYGGVAILWEESVGSSKKIDMANPDEFEVLVTTGSLRGQGRKMIVVACYLPPNLSRRRAED